MKLPKPDPKADRKLEPPAAEAGKRPVFICDRCGTKMLERNCKIICPNCGNRFDCSDLNLYFD